jgi:AraC-like DNA-binding protein
MVVDPRAISLPVRHIVGGYREYVAPPLLAPVSDAVWIHHTPAEVPLAGAAMHRVLPDAAFGLTFNCYREAGGRPISPRLLLLGPVVTPHFFALRPGYEVAAVMVKREWVWPLFGLEPDAHDDFGDDLSLVLPRLAESMFGPLTETLTAPEALAVLVAAVARRTQRQPVHRPETATRALDLIRRTRGRLCLNGVADRTGLSIRHLRRVVRRDAGVSLKAFARTVRLLQAVTAADRTPRGERPCWTRLATEAGYCDQAHLARDLQELCGITPTQAYRERRAQPTPASTPDLTLDGRNLQDF